jgi:hypothetical protein
VHHSCGNKVSLNVVYFMVNLVKEKGESTYVKTECGLYPRARDVDD